MDEKLMQELRELVKSAVDKTSRSPDPFLRMKGRFGSEVYVPFAEWMYKELTTLKGGSDVRDGTTNMIDVMAEGLGRVLGPFMVYVSRPGKPNSEQRVASVFIDALDKAMRDEMEVSIKSNRPRSKINTV